MMLIPALQINRLKTRRMTKVIPEALPKILTIKRIELMGKIAEQWEPFEIQVTIEGETKSLLVVPDREEPKYQIF
jgi:hypothetical protein